MNHITIWVEDIVSGESAVFVRDSSPVNIGRSPACSVAIDRGCLSNLHGSIRFDGDEVTYADLESLNGSTLDGRPLEGNEAVAIAAGSQLVLGKRLRIVVSPGRPATPPDPSQPNPFAAPSGDDVGDAGASATRALSGHELTMIDRALRAKRSGPPPPASAEPPPSLPTAPTDTPAPIPMGVPVVFEPRAAPEAWVAVPPVDGEHQEPPPSVFAPKTRLGRYYIVRLIDSGGMGQVYRAEDPDTGHVVAIKTLAPDLVSRPDARARFLQEGMAASRVDHHNVIKIHGYDVHQGIPYLKMEYLRGAGLEKEIARGPLAIDRAAGLMGFVCCGMAAVHEHGIIHRDLKPSNIFLAQTDEGEVVKILDFGVSKLRSGGVAMTRTSSIIGSYPYMSPEQARGAALDARSDQFAIGVILYELLTGRRPHDGSGQLAVCENIIKGRYRPPRERRADIPESLEAIIIKAMSLAPEDRFRSVLDLGEAIARFASPLIQQQLVAIISSVRTKGGGPLASQQIPREWFVASGRHVAELPLPSPPHPRHLPPTEDATSEPGRPSQDDPASRVVAGRTQLLPELGPAVPRTRRPTPIDRPLSPGRGSPRPRIRSQGPARKAALPRALVVAGGGALIAIIAIVLLVVASRPPRSVAARSQDVEPSDESTATTRTEPSLPRPPEAPHVAPPAPPAVEASPSEASSGPGYKAPPPAMVERRRHRAAPSAHLAPAPDGVPGDTRKPEPAAAPPTKAHILE